MVPAPIRLPDAASAFPLVVSHRYRHCSTPSILTIALLLMESAKTALSVPLLQYDATQAVLESFYPTTQVEAHPSAQASLHPAVPESRVPVSLLPLPRDPVPVPFPVPNPTRSFWTHGEPDANPLAREGSEGELTTDADVCIIGSGITGVGTAWHLAKGLKDLGEKKRIVVLEARDFCSGATGRNGGHLTPSLFLDFTRRQVLYGTEDAIRASALEAHVTESLLDLVKQYDVAESVDLQQDGHITLLFTPEEEVQARADFAAAKEAGVQGLDTVQFIDAETMNKTRGTPYPGIFNPGNNLWPLKLMNKAFLLAKQSSTDVEVLLHTQTPVTAVHSVSDSESSTKRKYRLQTPRGTIECDVVVHATNAHANALINPDTSGVRVVPTRGQVIAARPSPVEGAPTIKGGWGANEGFEYWFPRPARRGEEGQLVILGGGREVALPRYEFYEADDGKMNEEVGTALKKFLPGVYPNVISGVKTEWEWSGIMGFTPTGDPFVGRLKGEGGKQYIAAGFSGHGMPRAWGCAEALAGMIIADLKGTKWVAPEWIPKHYILS